MNEHFKGKVSFNPDPIKQVQQVIFSCKPKKANHSF